MSGNMTRDYPAAIRALLLASVLGGALTAQAPAKVDFARDIQPLLKEHCFECHGPSQQMRGLRLDLRRDALPNRVGANGARIVPGSSVTSLLYRRISGTQRGAQMPPAGPLTPEQINTFQIWIDQGAEWPDELSGEKDTTPPNPVAVKLMSALRNGDGAAFDRLLRVTPEAANAQGSGGWTPLMYATLYGDAETVRLLLSKGAKPNAQNEAGGTALMYATDNEEKTKILLDQGADPNLRSGEGRTALLIAAGLAGSSPVVKILLDKGADPRAVFPDGRGALSAASGSRDPGVFRLLLDHGVKNGPVPLSQVLIGGCTECFDLLLPLAQTADVSGGLQGAIRTGDVPRIRILLEHGAHPAATLLQVAAVSRAALPPDTIQSLISRGADVNAKTSAGLTTLDFAKRQGNATLVDVLTQAGATGETISQPQLARKSPLSPRAAIETVLPALQRADVAFLQKAGCVSCHNNSLTAMAVAAARAKGVRVNEQSAKDQSRKIAAFLQENAERALENDGLPGGIDAVSYILLGLAADGYPGDPATDVWARYVKNNQSSDGHWVCGAVRPPLESSDFEVTAASIRSLKAYGLKSQKAGYDKAVERAVHWLEISPATNTEDVAFKILGLIWGGGKQSAIRTTARQLLALQRVDGGWSQVNTLPSDAYATGQALFALNEARAVKLDSPAYRGGIQYLLNAQLEDGSWHVRTRAVAIQPYFDSDFPHGRDQFISAAASNWASMALAPVVR